MSSGNSIDHGGVVRRSVFQNADTCVEVLVHSRAPSAAATTTAGGRSQKAPPSHGSSSLLSGSAGFVSGGSGAGLSGQTWPVALAVRRDGRPVAAPSGGGGGKRQRAVALCGGGGGGGAEQCQVDQLQVQLTAWLKKITRLVQEIAKRPAVSHIRPVLNRLEMTLSNAPQLAHYHLSDTHHQQQQQHQELQEHNEQLQNELDTLKAEIHQYRERQHRLSSTSVAVNTDASAPGDHCKNHAVEDNNNNNNNNSSVVVRLKEQLDACKHQLNKHRKYAKDAKRAKHNMMTSMQTIEETHRAEVKSTRDHYESQISTILQQFSGETEQIHSYKQSVESVREDLQLRQRQIEQLKVQLALSNTEITRLKTINQHLQSSMSSQVRRLDAAVHASRERHGDSPDCAGSGDESVQLLPQLDNTATDAPAAEEEKEGNDTTALLQIVSRPVQLAELTLGSLDASFRVPSPVDISLPHHIETAEQDRGDDEEFARNARAVLQRLEGVRLDIDKFSRTMAASQAGDAPLPCITELSVK